MILSPDARQRRWRLTLLIVLACVPRAAAAYCLRSTCGKAAGTVCTPARRDDCGTPVRWSSGSVTYEIAGSDEPLRPVIAASVDRALARWRNAACGGGAHPALVATMVPAGSPHTAGAARGTLEVSDERRDPDRGDLAITRLVFAPGDGRVVNARVRFYRQDLAAHGTGAFLDSIVLHEVGHLLGLAHSPDPNAVMSGAVDGAIARTELSHDDEAAICASYPPAAAVAPRADRSGVARRLTVTAAIAVAVLLGWYRVARARRNKASAPPQRPRMTRG